MATQRIQRRKTTATKTAVADSRIGVAHKLLIELLACQFAFPVRWIETQNELFSREDAITRFVEFGPAKILGGMAKQTIDTKFADRDMSRGIERQFLSSKSDEKKICYDYDEPEFVEEHKERSEPAPPETLIPTSAAPPPPQAHDPAATSVPDLPVSALDIVVSLVARKLNKAFDETPIVKSIKELCNGKSTLQNELVGILGEEFASLPSGPEEMPLSLLDEAIEPNFSGSLGKESSRTISKMMSSKMPAGLSQRDVRNYLESSWGLGTGRQNTVILFATTLEPDARISSVEAGKEYFDGLALRYSASCGADLSKASASAGNAHQSAITSIDSGQLDELRSEQNAFLTKTMNVLSGHLNVQDKNLAKIAQLEPIELELRARTDLWISEFDESFETGITPYFEPKKERHYDHWWNLVREDVLRLYYRAEAGKMSEVDDTLEDDIHHIVNRCDYSVRKLVENLTIQSLDKAVKYTGFGPIGKRLISLMDATGNNAPVFKFSSGMTAPSTNVTTGGKIEYKEVPRKLVNVSTYPDMLRQGTHDKSTGGRMPFVHVRSKQGGGEWKFDQERTDVLLESFDIGFNAGISFAGKTVLLTGAGPKSIGAEVLRGLLEGGAKVIVTTSRPPADTKDFYKTLYAEHGSRDSELKVLPFNQGSKRDCEALIDYIYSESGLARNLDAVLPFAAISDEAELDDLGARSELAHRVMLVNLLRILGHIVRNKNERHIDTRPTQVILPLSPNHGNFGGDGLYSESKLGLEGLLNRFHSETWSDSLLICGAVIGWTRGTGLMGGNDLVAQSIESHNVITFSQKEMAFNLLALMTEPVVQMCESEPIWADLNGGLHLLPNVKQLLVQTRADLNRTSKIRIALANEDARQESVLTGPETGLERKQINIDKAKPRSTLQTGYPKLPDFEQDVIPLNYLQGMVDPGSVPVIVGFSELGPLGSSRTRWEIESLGTFSQEGYIEMAWIMNLIKFFDGYDKGKHHAGWVDAKTGERVLDSEVGQKYGKQILDHSGVRFVEPDLCGGYDPAKKEYMHEVAIEEDMPEFDAPRATAEAFKLRHGNAAVIRRIGDTDEFKVQIKRGASVMISKSVPFEGFVAGQIPTGWDPTKYGIPEDIVRQVDPVTQYALCCAAEALYSAGITDAYELLQHVHISEIGNFIGSMMGGITKTREMYKDNFLDKDVQGDVMQETYLSTTAAWINMLLLGSAGPIKTPTGACATGIESIDSACESLLSGKTKLCFVGGTDDFQEEESYAFRTMNATINATEELAKGRLPTEMSRPTSTTRSGFVESQGSGVQIITTADLALKLGLPIYGIIGSSTMASDKIGRSVPAPGQGVLSFARETPEASNSPLLDLEYRREGMVTAIEGVKKWRDESLRKIYIGGSWSSSTLSPFSDFSEDSSVQSSVRPEALSASIAAINATANSQIREARKFWGTEFRKQNADISPLRASLAVWGLTVDDIDIASLHATSTKANDKNEPSIINQEMAHLGRSEGHPMLAICQKSVTGHPKAPAAAFMLNGCLQAMNTGLVPGNRNADNVDCILSQYQHIVFPTRPTQVKNLKAFSLTSFGFGQKGGQIIGLHPRYLYATLDHEAYSAYSARVYARTRVSGRAFQKAIMTNSIVKCKDKPPYAASDETRVLMDPRARAVEDPANATSEFDNARLHPEDADGDSRETSRESLTLSHTPVLSGKPGGVNLAVSASKLWLEDVAVANAAQGRVNVGIDVEEVSGFKGCHEVFIERNYTVKEKEWARGSVDPQIAFAGRWSAKEAVFKSLGVKSMGAGAAMKDIEILADMGAPVVKLHGDAYAAAQEAGIQEIKLSLSHSDNTVIAVALATKGDEVPTY